MQYSLEIAEKIQSLLDAGHNRTKVSKILGLHHSTVIRIIKRNNLEIYTPLYDEPGDNSHLSQNFEWLFAEDKLEEMWINAFDGKKVMVNRSQDEDLRFIGKYVLDEYGDLKNYFVKKGKKRLIKYILIKCPSCLEYIPLKGWYSDSSKLWGLHRQCPDCKNNTSRDYNKRNPEKLFLLNQKYREMADNLPTAFNKLNWRAVREKFNWRCSLSNKIGNISIDHVIPVSIGHGGTYIENLIPLEFSINCSKNNKNIFKWFETNRQRFEISQSKFDSLIERLASANALTFQEYREFYDWCFANPRNIDEIKADQRHSIEIWREAVGKQFPLPAYTKTYRLNESVENEAV